MLNLDLNAGPETGGPLCDTIECRAVDPLDVGPAAAEILRLAWAPPCLYYSDDYVNWQLAFPGTGRARAALATHGLRTVGFMAAIPRRIWLDGRVASIHVRSCLAVHPEYRGMGVAGRLVRLILATDGTTVGFTEPGSPTEHILAASARARGLTFRRAAELRTYAFTGTRRDPDPPAVVREAAVDEFKAAADGCTGGGTAWSRPTANQLRHYAEDPRGSCLAIAHGRDGTTLGAGLIVRSHIVTARGVEVVPSLDAVFLHRGHDTALAALGMFALDRWQSDGPAVVTAPNLHTVPPDAIRRAGFRATRSAFNLLVIGDESDPIVRYTRTSNLEVF
jgi:GNAT superfamily N-acetyltransferase